MEELNNLEEEKKNFLLDRTNLDSNGEAFTWCKGRYKNSDKAQQAVIFENSKKEFYGNKRIKEIKNLIRGE